MRERDIQRAVVKYVRYMYPKVLIVHVPNEGISGKMGRIYGAIKKQEGVVAGFPDLLIFKQTFTHCGLALELKSKKGKPSENQKRVLSQLEAEGWVTAICYSTDEALEHINNYLN